VVGLSDFAISPTSLTPRLPQRLSTTFVQVVPGVTASPHTSLRGMMNASFRETSNSVRSLGGLVGGNAEQEIPIPAYSQLYGFQTPATAVQNGWNERVVPMAIAVVLPPPASSWGSVAAGHIACGPGLVDNPPPKIPPPPLSLTRPPLPFPSSTSTTTPSRTWTSLSPPRRRRGRQSTR
jgi:hypothetical protein